MQSKPLLALVPSWFAPYLELSRLYQPLFVFITYLPLLAGLFHGALVSPLRVAPEILLKSVVNWLPISLLWQAFACIVNDVIDQDLDRKVERTKNRPIARGALSTTQGWLFAATVALIILAMNLTMLPFCSLLYFFAAAFGCIFYTYTKRFTYYSQAFVGVVHGFWSLSSSYSIGFDASSAPRPIMVSNLCMVTAVVLLATTYEFIYTYQDVDDDIKLGLKSMAVRYRHSGRGVLIAFSLVYAGLLIASGSTAALGVNYFTGAACSAVTVFWSTVLVDLKSPPSCRDCFLYGFIVGSATLALGLCAELLW
ncbi:Para-hydroxybenzoate--polyprenyltransferase, mitochondrial precursor (PHB:polyprenyltransferase) [Aspergillus hancockii]|nr:Para-hydroxybenzoate--polyprenyltransferase, mitochondrial precursor (PHB:polyprenyltransferase) [Aspergillus hancockii]